MEKGKSRPQALVPKKAKSRRNSRTKYDENWKDKDKKIINDEDPSTAKKPRAVQFSSESESEAGSEPIQKSGAISLSTTLTNADGSIVQQSQTPLVKSRPEEDAEAEAETQLFISEYFQALKPFLIFAKCICIFPLKLKMDDGTKMFSYNAAHPRSLIFFIIHISIIVITIAIILNFMGLLMNVPPQRSGGVTSSQNTTARAEELFIFKRNMAPLVIFLSSLFHVNIGNWNFHLKRKYSVIYLNFWPEAIKALRFNAAVGIYKTMALMIGSYCFFIVTLLLLTFIRIAPVTSGFPTLIGMFTVRFFHPAIHASTSIKFLKILASLFILYIIIASKTYPMLFIIKCKLLRNSFALWNRRLDIILNKPDMYFDKDLADSMTDKISFPDMFRGHALLLDLLDGNDGLFSETIESYLGSQITSLVFEFYYFYRANSGHQEFDGARSFDQIVVGLYLIHSLIFLLFVVISANAVNVEAMDGLEIVRRRGFLGKRSNDELYFLLSMYVSYTGHFETGVQAAGYFVYNKTYFVVIFGAIATYLVIFFQFGPSLDLNDPQLRPQILDEVRLLKFVEDTSELFSGTKVGTLLMDAFQIGQGNDTIKNNLTFSEY